VSFGEKLVARRGGRLAGVAAVPGDKSISHRALILAAMAEGESRICGLSDAVDVARTVTGLRAFGMDLREDDGEWRVKGRAWRSPEGVIDCGNAGTAARLLIGAAVGRKVQARFDGDDSLRNRPMDPVFAALRAMGGQIVGNRTLPAVVLPGELTGISFINATASAQLKSALLLAGLAATGRTEIAEPQPSRDHTELMLPLFGVPVERTGKRVVIDGPAALRAAELAIPGDVSAAAFPLVAALLVTGSEVTARGVGANPLRTGLIETLMAMGANLTVEPRGGVEPVADYVARTSSLKGITVPAIRAPRMIDEYPILAIAAARAEGETVMHGVGALRHKESNRLAALVDGLTACGVAARCEGDSLIVCGGRVPGGAKVQTHGDHRIAMAFLVLGLVSEAPIIVDGAEMIATSFPGFAATMRRLGARIEPA
jgi:3-phosphoshikimate 1-carboxyvinyltransferase